MTGRTITLSILVCIGERTCVQRTTCCTGMTESAAAGMDITGATVEATGLGFDQGDADRICRPVPHTLAPAPWQSRPLGQLLMSMFEHDGNPFFADPLAIPRRLSEPGSGP